jgi:hypothetical protein
VIVAKQCGGGGHLSPVRFSLCKHFFFCIVIHIYYIHPIPDILECFVIVANYSSIVLINSHQLTLTPFTVGYAGVCIYYIGERERGREKHTHLHPIHYETNAQAPRWIEILLLDTCHQDMIVW